MQSLGEMATMFPLPGMIAQIGTRFVDPALGFVIGANQWYNCAIAICAETSAAVVLIQFWTDINVINPKGRRILQLMECSLPHGSRSSCLL